MAGIFLVSGENLVEMREQPYDSEDLLQALLAKYPSLLAGDEGGSRRWLLVKRETGVPSAEGGGGRWSLDHLFIDRDAVPTLVEVKRSDDTRIRREVVGQMLDYAANGVVYWPAARLRADFESRCAGEGKDPETVFHESLGEDLDADEFWQLVEQNLRAGLVRLVFVSDEIPAELRRVIEFLNKGMTRTEVIGIEIRQYVGEGDLRTLVPRVVGQTEETRNKGATSREYVDADWDYYKQSLSDERYAVARELYERIEKAIADRHLPWSPILRRGYLGFQRAGGYYAVGMNLNREKPIRVWIKLPLSFDELVALGHDIEDPYPQLASHWNGSNKQWEWEVPTVMDVPDLGSAIDLTRPYQPESGAMPLPASRGS
jgi:hypothetical protein